MAGVVLENISTKKLVPICFFLLGLSLTCFIIGGKLVPAAVHTQSTMGHWCQRKFPNNKEVDWYPARGPERCDELAGGINDPKINELEAKQIVFSFQYPLPRDNEEKYMSRWFMYHFTILSFNIDYRKDNNPAPDAKVKLIVNIGYNDDNSSTNWQPLLHGEVERFLKCTQPDKPQEGYRWDCDFMDLFEIGNMHHKQYLVNIRIPPNKDTSDNTDIGQLSGVDLVWFAQTGGFTLYFLVLKTLFFAMILPLTIWNYKRVSDLNRPAVFLEKLLLALAVAALVLNLPVDWLILVTEMKFMLLWSDIRQGVFLAVLLTYWMVFTGEHMMDDEPRGQFNNYWKQLSTVMLACILMFVFDICERGVRIVNPFFSIWATPTGTNIGKAFIGLSTASAILYCLILTIFVLKAIYNMWKKRSQFKSMAKGLRVQYMSVIYRFFFAMLFSAVCSILTIVAFAMGQIFESQWKWDLDHDIDIDEDGIYDKDTSWIPDLKGFEINSAFQLGVYGTWNVYVMAMLIFYAPSHKRVPLPVDADADENEERVELTTISSDHRARARTSVATSLGHADDTTDETVNLTTGQRLTGQNLAQIHTLCNKPTLEVD